MDDKHTTGKWSIEEILALSPGQEMGMADICVMDADGEGYTIVARVPFDDEEEKANANLMAAAPDLLAAAERYFEFRHGADCGFGYRFSGEHPATQLKLAIARARGEA